MLYENSLEHYTKSIKNLNAFKEKHLKFVNEMSELESIVKGAEEVLKKAAGEAKESRENKMVQVKVSLAFKKWFDYPTLLKLAKPEELAIINQKATITEVDKEAFEKLVANREIRPELKQKSFREEELSPRVSIKLKEQS